MKKQRKIYKKEFKIKAVELSNARGNCKEIAEELGIPIQSLYQWRKDYKKYKINSFPGKGVKKLTAEEKKMIELEKTNRDLAMENEILKKAIGIFSRKDGKSSYL